MAVNRMAVIRKLAEYFSEKGKIYDIKEYKVAEDTPFRFQSLRRAFGSWNRLRQQVENSKYYDPTERLVKPKKDIREALKKAEKQNYAKSEE